MNGNVNDIESSKSDYLFLNTTLENLFILQFEQKDVEAIHYGDDFLQKNVVEMSIVKVSCDAKHCRTPLISQIRDHIDKILSKDDAVISITVSSNGLKHNLILRCLQTNSNANLQFLEYEVNMITFFFLFNEDKTSMIKLYKCLRKYFYTNYRINWALKG